MLPRLDPNVVYRGVSFLRKLNATQLKELTGAIVIQGAGNEPLAVIVSAETWQRVQCAVERPRITQLPRIDLNETDTVGGGKR